MSQAARPVPENYGSVTPYVMVKGAARFIAFLERAFGAQERGRVSNDDGTIGHAEVRIGDSVVRRLSGCSTPRTIGRRPQAS